MHTEDAFSHNWLARKLVNDRVREVVKDLRGTVIDLGCGIRPYEKDILAYADEYIGVDWSETLHGLHADILADLNQPLPIRDGAADCAITFEVLEHVAEPAVMLQEIYRILRSGGQLALSIPFQWWVHEAPWDYQRFTRFGLQYQLNKAGFVDIKISENSGFWSMWILKFNYQTARLVHGRWWRRIPARILLIPIWWLNQTLAPILDRIWQEDRETAGYFVTARKP